MFGVRGGGGQGSRLRFRVARFILSPGWLSGLVVNMQASSRGQRPSVRVRAVGGRFQNFLRWN